MINFEDTSIAFDRLKNKELWRARLLFSVLAFPWMVKTGKTLIIGMQKMGISPAWFVKPTVYKHFVGGETLSACNPVVESLSRYGVKSILDYSVEAIQTEKAIEAVLKETLNAIRNAAANHNIPFAVFKPTAFVPHSVLDKTEHPDSLTAEDKIQLNLFRERIDILCHEASQLGIPLLIDAEDSWYQAFIDDLVESMMKKYNREKTIVFNTLQMYRHDRISYLQGLIQRAEKAGFKVGLKFVRGAYMEKERARAQLLGYPSPIQPDKAATDRDFNFALKISMEHIDRVSIFCGTHNEESNQLLAQLIIDNGLKTNDERIWFSQLYGMSDHISFNLAKAGFNVAKYIPYGPVKHVMPYLFRRAEENTSVAGQTSRELRLIRKEFKRRKSVGLR
ncbi:MAG: proline dehydrogenase [Bacteroidales bacterium]|jgi:proline dehydrogenase|nr:proline dehydrogenase [Bacteroidales bacterium]MDN5328326.1 proline dehydrogenase [Bacteroidales bacterium]